MTSEIVRGVSKQMRAFSMYSNSIQHTILFAHLERLCVLDNPRSILDVIPTLHDLPVVLGKCHATSMKAMTMSHSYFLWMSNPFLVCSQRTQTWVISRVIKQEVRCDTPVTWSLGKQRGAHVEGCPGRDSCWHTMAALLMNISLIVTWETFWWRETGDLGIWNLCKKRCTQGVDWLLKKCVNLLS